jgi:hypothetical protein
VTAGPGDLPATPVIAQRPCDPRFPSRDPDPFIATSQLGAARRGAGSAFIYPRVSVGESRGRSFASRIDGVARCCTTGSSRRVVGFRSGVSLPDCGARLAAGR